MSTIQDQAMLVETSIGKWDGFKYDPDLSKKLLRQHGAKDGAARVNKLIVPESAIDPLKKAFNRVYTAHRELTLPWFDKGPRALPSALYFQYCEKIGELTREALREADRFFKIYPRLVADAPNRMGGMLKQSDFPPLDHLREMFYIRTNFLPIPDTDIRTKGISEEELERINETKEQATNDAIARMTGELWQRAYKVVAHMVDRLNAYKRDAKSNKVVGKFHDTLVENVRELVDLLPVLNFTNDPDLAKMTKLLKRELCVVDAEELREDPAKRKKVVLSAEEILKKMEEFI